MTNSSHIPFTRTRTDEWYKTHITNNTDLIIEDFPTPVIENHGLLEETRDELTLDLLQLELELIGVV